MGTKYIIEVEDKPFELLSEDGFTSEKLFRVKGFNSLVFDWNGLNMLTPYTEPDLERVKKEAYDKGYHDGYFVGDESWKDIVHEKEEEFYQKGLSDAWKAVRKIIHMPEGDLLNIFTECYSAVCTALQVILKYDAPEAIEKIRQYEQEQEEYHIGDEVIRHYKNEFMEGDDAPSIFLSEEDGNFRCIAFNGRSIIIAEYPKHQYRKTGRHFPEIATILEQMRGEQDG